MKLHLGVKDTAYVDHPGVTTGDVAEHLERKYGVMGHFYADDQEKIHSMLTESMNDSLIDIMNGRQPPKLDKVFNGATSEIKRDFTKFIRSKAMDGQVAGVPTKASLAGVSSRFKSGNRNTASRKKVRANPVRPSFIDTGLYLRSFVAWVEK